MSNEPVCFIVNGAIDRLDCTYNNPVYVDFYKKLKERSDTVELKQICEVTDGNHEETQYVDDGVPILTMKNVQEDNIDLTHVKYITPSFHEGRLKRSRLKPGDIVLTKLGSFNHAHVIPNGFGEANTSAELAVIKIKSEYKNKVNPQYLSFYLSSDYTRNQTDRNATGLTTRDRTVLTELRKIRVILPDPPRQNLVMVKASSKLQEALNSYSRFETTISEIKLYFDKMLNMHFGDKEKMSVFVIDGTRSMDRIDCYANSPTYSELISEIRQKEAEKFTFKKGVEFELSETLGKSFLAENNLHIFRYLDIGNTNKELGGIIGLEEDFLINLPTRARKKANIWDVLLPVPQGSSESAVIIEEETDNLLYSTGFIGMRNKSEEEALILWAALKSKIVQDQLFYLQSGSLQPGISQDDFKQKLLIPVPNETMQEKIAQDIRRLRIEATNHLNQYRNMKQEAKEIFMKELQAVTLSGGS